MTGKVFICGAGPGDPDLLTLKSMKLLKTCKVVLYDRLVGNNIVKLIPDTSKKIYVGREEGDPSFHQDNTNKIMKKYAKKGEKVLRLKGGDPFIFGRGGEEAEFLREHNIQYEIVPGVTSPIASAIYAGIPLTHRQFSSSIAIVTGHEATEKGQASVHWEKLPDAVDTIIIMMGIGQLRRISTRLIRAGMSKDTDVAIIENGATSKQRVVTGTLENIIDLSKKAEIKPPAIIIIGRVVSFGEKISWFQDNSS
jgi:uroporphyrin-III C-methyltransferase